MEFKIILTRSYNFHHHCLGCCCNSKLEFVVFVVHHIVVVELHIVVVDHYIVVVVHHNVVGVVVENIGLIDRNIVENELVEYIGLMDLNEVFEGSFLNHQLSSYCLVVECIGFLEAEQLLQHQLNKLKRTKKNNKLIKL